MLPKEVKSISLDRLEASLAILAERERARGYPLKNDPPTILFSTKPAMLIVHGPAVITRQNEVFISRGEYAGLAYVTRSTDHPHVDGSRRPRRSVTNVTS